MLIEKEENKNLITYILEYLYINKHAQFFSQIFPNKTHFQTIQVSISGFCPLGIFRHFDVFALTMIKDYLSVIQHACLQPQDQLLFHNMCDSSVSL